MAHPDILCGSTFCIALLPGSFGAKHEVDDAVKELVEKNTPLSRAG
jgi:hypothetical protein